jgi:hypothetical protein
MANVLKGRAGNTRALTFLEVASSQWTTLDVGERTTFSGIRIERSSTFFYRVNGRSVQGKAKMIDTVSGLVRRAKTSIAPAAIVSTNQSEIVAESR